MRASFSTSASLGKSSAFVNRKTGRFCGSAVMPRQVWRYERAGGRHFQKTMAVKFGVDMGIEDRILLAAVSQRQRRLDDKKMRQLAAVLEARITDALSTDETLAELAIQLTSVSVDRAFTHVNVSWLCRGEGDDDVQTLLDQERHQLRRRVGEMLSITCPEVRFVGDKTALMEAEMDRLFREADYGIDYRALSRTGRVLGAVRPEDADGVKERENSVEKVPAWLEAIRRRRLEKAANEASKNDNL